MANADESLAVKTNDLCSTVSVLQPERAWFFFWLFPVGQSLTPDTFYSSKPLLTPRPQNKLTTPTQQNNRTLAALLQPPASIWSSCKPKISPAQCLTPPWSYITAPSLGKSAVNPDPELHQWKEDERVSPSSHPVTCISLLNTIQ